MPGLDHSILNSFQKDIAFNRISEDIRSDFILSPHYNAIFTKAGDEIWGETISQLSSGNYHPGLPYTISVPKGRGFTRPGSILDPVDRIVYQLLADSIAQELEDQLDRNRVHSYQFNNSPEMYTKKHVSWNNFRSSVNEICEANDFILKLDIAHYFQSLPQHHLINLITSSGINGSIKNLLEEMLLSFQERDSFGIIQGVFPSDLLGNYFLVDLDFDFAASDIPSARYVDDFYVGFKDKYQAKKGLVRIVERLRKSGLSLNEYKSGIYQAEDLIREESVVDQLFQDAQDEITREFEDEIGNPYGFSVDWSFDEEDIPKEYIELEATERLFNSKNEYPDSIEAIEKFCLPVLGRSLSSLGIDHSIDSLIDKDHLTKVYCTYLLNFIEEDYIVDRLVETIEGKRIVTDYQLMYLLGTLFKASQLKSTVCKTLIVILRKLNIRPETRALAAIVVAKHGTPAQKKLVKQHYEDEPSEYVRSAILFSTQYFSSVEKRTCRIAWSGHNFINSIISRVVQDI